MRFLAMIWTSPIPEPHSNITEVVQARALVVGNAYIESRDHETVTGFLADYCPGLILMTCN